MDKQHGRAEPVPRRASDAEPVTRRACDVLRTAALCCFVLLSFVCAVIVAGFLMWRKTETDDDNPWLDFEDQIEADSVVTSAATPPGRLLQAAYSALLRHVAWEPAAASAAPS